MTPLKSPNPETEPLDLKALSSSSSVEVVSHDGTEENQADHLQKYVQERMASLGLKPGRIYCKNHKKSKKQKIAVKFEQCGFSIE